MNSWVKYYEYINTAAYNGNVLNHNVIKLCVRQLYKSKPKFLNNYKDPRSIIKTIKSNCKN